MKETRTIRVSKNEKKENEEWERERDLPARRRGKEARQEGRGRNARAEISPR